MGISLPGSRAERKDYRCDPEEESFAIMATWMEPINPFLLKRKGKKSEFPFSKQRLFFFFKCLIIFFFFQTNFHACLGVESWFLKSVGDPRGQNNSHSWVKLWMRSDFAVCLHPPFLFLLCSIPSLCSAASDWDCP